MRYLLVRPYTNNPNKIYTYENVRRVNTQTYMYEKVPFVLRRALMQTDMLDKYTRDDIPYINNMVCDSELFVQI